MNNKTILITVTGPDKPGLVSALSHVVADHDGNWLEGRMANLAGQFTGMLLVEISAAREAELLVNLQALDATGLTLSSQPAVRDHALPDGHVVELNLLGQDHPGIVRDITKVLSQNGVSVQSLDTNIEEASMAGGMVFRAVAKLLVPTHLSTDDLHEKLQKISDGLLVEVALADIDPV